MIQPSYKNYSGTTNQPELLEEIVRILVARVKSEDTLRNHAYELRALFRETMEEIIGSDMPFATLDNLSDKLHHQNLGKNDLRESQRQELERLTHD